MAEKWFRNPEKISFDISSKETGVGILSRADLDKFHTSLSSTLDYATTVLEYNRSKGIERHDSGIVKHKMRKACKKLRSIYGTHLCFECDKVHFEVFVGKTRKELLQHKCINDIELNTIDEGDSEQKKRIYGEYRCPFFGYVEMIFPIFFEDKVIGVIFIGQLAANMKDRSLIRAKYFLSSIANNTYGCRRVINANLFSTFRNILSICFCGKEKIYLDNNAFLVFKLNIKKLLDDFELMLRMQVFMERKKDIDQIFARNKAQVFKDILEVIELKDNSNELLLKFWEIVIEETKRLFTELEIGEIYIFGNKGYKEDMPKDSLNLPLLYTNTNLADVKDFVVSSDFERNILYPSSTVDNKTMWKYLLACPIKNTVGENYEILFWPAYDKNCCVVFVISFVNEMTRNILIDDMRQFLITTILDYYSLLFSNYQSIWSVISKEKIIEQKKINEDAFSIFSHEIQQHTSTLSRLYGNNLSTDDQIMGIINEKKTEIISKDFFSSMKMMEYLANNSKIYLDILKPQKELFYAFSDKIFKFVSIFSRELHEKSIYIHTPSELNKNDDLRSEVFCDPILFEQIIYNVLKNALQYSHTNTKIYVDCKKDNNAETEPHKLTITNYGIKLDKTINPYGMHERGVEAKACYEKGTGIGLFIVKKIVRSIGGLIVDDGEMKVCDYNLPLIEPYLHLAALSPIDTELTNKIKNAFADVDITEKERCVNQKSKRYKKRFIMDRIRQSTWKTTFTIIIPPKEKCSR